MRKIKKAKKEDKMVQDPVCKMDVDEKKTPFKSTYDQKEYFFCSEQCKEDFESKPQLYLPEA